MLRRTPCMRIVSCLLVMFVLVPAANIVVARVQTRSGFPVTLSGDRVGFGSPTLADITGDGQLEIIVGGVDGKVSAVTQAGQVLWTFDVSGAINDVALERAPQPTSIASAPAVGDLNGDGIPEIVVTAGDVLEQPENGGVVVLNARGQLQPGWPQLPFDFYKRGYSDGIITSPAIGDITGDGVPEIVYGAFDQHVYAKSLDGENLPGWPQFVLDTVWSSPALADLDGDRLLDVIIGVDAHYYRGAPRDSEYGGDLYVFKGNGSILWRQHQDQMFQSSPAVADLDNDGLPEVVIGTGTYFSDANGRLGKYITAWNHDGSRQWRTPLSDASFGSPAIGDLDGDRQLEVVINTFDGNVHALRGATGQIMWSSNVAANGSGSPVLGDFDGDGLDDVFVAQGWEAIPLKGTTGQRLTTPYTYDTNFTLQGAPALGDLDNDGKLDLVAASGTRPEEAPLGQIFAWTLPNSTTTASWPMLRGNAVHSASFVEPSLQPSFTELNLLLLKGSQRTFDLSLNHAWTVVEQDPNNILTLSRTSGSAVDSLNLTVRAPTTVGTYTASIVVSSPGLPSETIPITVRVADRITSVYLPIIRR